MTRWRLWLTRLGQLVCLLHLYMGILDYFVFGCPVFWLWTCPVHKGCSGHRFYYDNKWKNIRGLFLAINVSLVQSFDSNLWFLWQHNLQNSIYFGRIMFSFDSMIIDHLVFRMNYITKVILFILVLCPCNGLCQYVSVWLAQCWKPYFYCEKYKTAIKALFLYYKLFA